MRRGGQALGRAALLCLLLTGCDPDHAQTGGSNGMFDLFKRKPAPVTSSVAPELGSSLKRETTLPRGAAAQPDGARCGRAKVVGDPPAGRFVGADSTERAHNAFRIPARAGQPPLAIVNLAGDVRRPQFWELKSDADPAFVRQRQVRLDPGEARWIIAGVEQVACLPGAQVAVGLSYATADTGQMVLVYDAAGNAVRKIGEAVYDGASGRPDQLIDARDAGPDRAVLLYHTGEIRLRAEVYAREHDHLVAFSPRHPQGIEVLKLGIDDGNIVEWLVVGKTLWLQTVDPRDAKQQPRFWSLDLSGVF